MSGAGFRVSIPNSLRKTIQDIKEITGNHSEEEIYAMLKECSMDPNETTQKLLLQDTFHEVKSKRDKRKESLSNRESAESRWRPGMQGRGSRGGRGNYSARYASHDAGGGKNAAPGKQNGGSQVIEKGGSSSSVSPQETKSKDMPSSVPVIANGPTAIASGGTSVVVSSHLTAEIGQVKHEVLASFVDVNALDSALPSNGANKKPSIAFGTAGTHGQPTPNSNDNLASKTPASSSAGCFSSSDPVLLPSSDPRFPCAVGTIKREVGSQRTPGEQNAIPAETKSSAAVSEVSSTFLQGKMPIKPLAGGKNQLSESSQPSSATHGTSSLSRPSSNYSSRSQQVIGPPRVGSNKEWKPKPTNPVIAQGPGSAASSEVPAVSVEASAQPQPGSNVLDSEEATTKLQKKLEELHLPQRQHVILPNHIHVPESERTKLSFGSFGANFGLTTSYVSGSESDNISTPASETSQVVEETVVEEASSNQNALVTNEEGNFPDQAQSTTPVTENLSPGDGDVSASAAQEYNESKQDTALLSGGHQYSVVHTSPNYNFGFVSPMFGSQLAPFENSESQARDVPRLPGFVVQQPFDPASYYAQFYRSGTESDGRISPFPSPGVATKYNGNVAVLPPQTSQSPQEGANSLVISTVGPTPLVTQAAGLVQSSLAVTQQPIPVFRPPAGMHISHYPPNYLPYGHYFSPFYVPPPIHQFLSNGAFPQQPQAGNVYPSPPAAAATGVKYPLPQYKPGGNAGNSAHIGMPSGYGPYGSSPANYNPSSAATTGNSTSNEDLGASQFKDNNAYITGQQSEGSAVWIGRDISNMPASSFYNLPPQGQHMAFTPTQAGHGTFAGMYHPAQAVTAATVHPLLQQSQTMAGAVDMSGPGATAYQQQQPQHSQINWPGNY